MKRILSFVAIILACTIRMLAETPYTANQLHGKWVDMGPDDVTMIFDASTMETGNINMLLGLKESEGGISANVTLSIDGIFILSGNIVKIGFDISTLKVADCNITGPGMNFTKEEMMELGKNTLSKNMDGFYEVFNSFNYLRILELQGNRLVVKDGDDTYTFKRTSTTVRR